MTRINCYIECFINQNEIIDPDMIEEYNKFAIKNILPVIRNNMILFSSPKVFPFIIKNDLKQKYLTCNEKYKKMEEIINQYNSKISEKQKNTNQEENKVNNDNDNDDDPLNKTSYQVNWNDK